MEMPPEASTLVTVIPLIQVSLGTPVSGLCGPRGMGLGHGRKLQSPPASPHLASCVQCGQNRRSPSREESNPLSNLSGQKGAGKNVGGECRRDSRADKKQNFPKSSR